MRNSLGSTPELALEEVIEADSAERHALIVHNDAINTFEWVIKALVEICQHTAVQAEQCSYIIHYRGKYAVKHGGLERLQRMRSAIAERGIHATVE
ncbi:MAG: ATP-dependent Clp protease adaptor ClpS [Chitinophagales bacterium]